MKKKITGFSSIVILYTTSIFSQNTFNDIHSIFQTKCTISCHSGASPTGNLDLSGSVASVYSNLVNITPTNPAASAIGDKLIDPGYPHRSFLMRKCNNNLDPDNGIIASEGVAMPNGQTPLVNSEIELIRQWILKGAPQTGNVVDTAAVNRYYRGKGINSIPVPPPAPTAPGSFQIHVGKIFVPKLSEVEYFLKYDLKLPDTVRVDRINVIMAKQSHHFIIYKLQPGASSSFAEGLRLLNTGTGGGSSSGLNTLVAAWQIDRDDTLPPNTSYLWETSSVLDFNYHIPNFNTDSTLAVDVYMDIYTKPKTVPDNIMYSTLINNIAINIPANNQPTTFSQADFSTSALNMWNVWTLATHTHKYGIDFDIFFRNPTGTKGSKVYEGYYDPTYTFNQGYYSWQHPAVLSFYRTLGGPLSLNPRDGLIQEATYKNYGSTAVYFGFTTDSEMMLYYIQYTLGQSMAAVQDHEKDPFSVSVYPNPFSSSTVIGYTLEKNADVKIELVDIFGKQIAVIADGKELAGNHQITLDGKCFSLQSGIYIVKITSNNVVSTKRIVLNQ